ncbi:MAG: AraC family transcriptional regulator [Verrucomicrobiota bacterium]
MMKCLKFLTLPSHHNADFQIHRLGIHEIMKPMIVDRPRGTGDYLFMLFHGEVEIQTDQTVKKYTPSHLMIWESKDSHFYGNKEKPWNHTWFHCSGQKITPFLKHHGIPFRKPLLIHDPSFFTKYLLETLNELQEWEIPSPKIVLNFFENFVEGIHRQISLKRASFASPQLKEAQNYIAQNYTERIRLSALAQKSGYTDPYFCSEFKKTFGMTVTQYILQLRMDQACYLLRDQNRRVGEIASLVGYPDLYTFSKMFKRTMGICPREFRNKKR